MENIRDKFKFRTNDELSRFDPIGNYTAENISSGTYRVTWEDQEEIQSCYYDAERVQKYIKEGLWLVLNEVGEHHS